MDNLFCDGFEKELALCRFDGWGRHDCDSTEAAGVVCIEEVSEQISDEETKVNAIPLGREVKM